MPISRTRKEELVAKYVDILNENDGFVVVQTQGLSVPQIEGLRNAVREQNGSYLVAKNTLMRRALEQADWAVPEELLAGPTAFIFGGSNMPGVSKVLLQHIKENQFDENMQVTGGVVSGDILDAGQVDVVSKLPTFEEIARPACWYAGFAGTRSGQRASASDRRGCKRAASVCGQAGR